MATQDFTTGLSDIVRYDGLINTPPPPDSPFAYDENVIIFLVTRVWEMMIALGYIERRKIAFPPPDGHQLDEAVLAEVGPIDDRVVSLMRHLPITCPVNHIYGEQEFANGVLLLSFVQGSHLRTSRDPGHRISWAADDGVTLDPMRPTDIMIGVQRYADSDSWILDVEANTIRVLTAGAGIVNSCQRDYPDYIPERADEDHNWYRNWPPFHAPTFLLNYVQRILKLEEWPMRDMVGSFDPSSLLDQHYRQRILDHGWPTNFRAEDWQAVEEDVWQEGLRLDEEREEREAAETHDRIRDEGGVSHRLLQ